MGSLARRRLERHDGRWLARPCWALCHWGTDMVMGTEASARGDRRERAMEEAEDEGGDDGHPQYTLESRRGKVSDPPQCSQFEIAPRRHAREVSSLEKRTSKMTTIWHVRSRAIFVANAGAS